MPIAFTEADIKGDTTRKRLKDGKFKFRITAASKNVNEKGNTTISAVARVVNENGDVVGPKTKLMLTLPIQTPPEDLAQAGLPADAQKARPNTIFFVTSYYTARKNPKNAEVYHVTPVQNVKKLNGRWAAVDAAGNPTGEELLTKEESSAAKESLAREVRQFISDIYDDPSVIVGDEFYGENTYDESFDSAKIEVANVTQDETGLADMTSLEA